jgi:Holliday junction resolvase RusA-like endonuclease
LKKPKAEGYYWFFIPERLMNLNDYIKFNRYSKYKGNSVKQETEDLIQRHIKKQLKWLEIRKPVLMVFTWSELNKMRDPDNICFAKKFILDALVKCGVLPNDGWGQVSGFNDRFKVDRENPGVLVEMFEFEIDEEGERRYEVKK